MTFERDEVCVVDGRVVVSWRAVGGLVQCAVCDWALETSEPEWWKRADAHCDSHTAPR
jgi:hypothetical protein